MNNTSSSENNLVQRAMEYINGVRVLPDEASLLVERIIRYGYCSLYGAAQPNYFQKLLGCLGFTDEQLRRIAERDFPQKVIVPVDVAIIRHYRTYVECYEGADGNSIRQKAVQHIVELQDGALTLDPDLEIEEHDLEYLRVDYDGAMED